MERAVLQLEAAELDGGVFLAGLELEQRDRVAVQDVNWWAATFLSDLWIAAGEPWHSGASISLAI